MGNWGYFTLLIPELFHHSYDWKGGFSEFHQAKFPLKRRGDCD